MVQSFEKFIDYQPTIGQVVEVGGNSVEIFNFDPVKSLEQGIKKNIAGELSSTPRQTPISPENSVLEIFDSV